MQLLALALLLGSTDVRYWLDPHANLESPKWTAAIWGLRFVLLVCALVVLLRPWSKRVTYTPLIVSLCLPLSGLIYRRALQHWAAEPVDSGSSIAQAYELGPALENLLELKLRTAGGSNEGFTSQREQSQQLGNLKIRSSHWSGSLSSGANPLGGWIDTLKRLDWLEARVLDCRFANQQQNEWTCRARVEAAGVQFTGQPAFLTGTLQLRWRREAAGWKILTCQAQDLTSVQTDKVCYREVLSQVITDPAEREAALYCPYEQQILASLRGQSHASVSMSAGYKRRPSIQIVDIDGDGWDDIFCTRRSGSCLLLQNQRNGTFQECSKDWGLDLAGPIYSALFADFDNDGDPDLIVGRASGLAYFQHEDKHYRPLPAAITAIPDVSSLAAADVNKDGLLDFYAAGFGNEPGSLRTLPRPDYLFLNQGTRFDSLPLAQGKQGGSAQVLFAWFNPRASAPQAYVSSYSGPDRLWSELPLNRPPSTVQGYQTSGLGASVADVDLDGTLDLFISEPELNLAEYVRYAGHRVGRPGSALYRNRQGRLERDEEADFSACDWPTAGQFVDFNQDGLPDLYIPCGFYTAPRVAGVSKDPRGLLTSRRAPQRNHAYLNVGEGHFLPITGLTGADLLPDPRGLVHFDFNHDGMPDLALVNLQRPYLQILQNQLDPAPILAVSLKGGNRKASPSPLSNRDGIGAVVYVAKAGRRLVQEMRCGEGYGAQNSGVLLFGLAGDKSAESYQVEVRWPSGRRQFLKSALPGEKLEFDEAADLVKRTAYR